MAEQEEQITLLLKRMREGDRDAESQLLIDVYDHLHRIAERQFRSEREGHTLQPTALISELYLRVLRDTSIDWQSRAHFYSVAAQTIRRILVDYARAANAEMRPKPSRRIEIDEVSVYSADRAYDILIVDEALEKLRAWDERQARVVDLRYFAGFSIEEIARALGISDRTVKRDWEMARAWLSAFLNGPEDKQLLCDAAHG